MRRTALLALAGGLTAAGLSLSSLGAAATRKPTQIVYDGGRTCANHGGCGGPRFNKAIYVVGALHGAPKRLTSRRYSDSEPAWSPDRHFIAFTRFRLGLGADVYVMRADGSGARRLTHSRDGKASQPDWSPDGSRIVYRDAGPNGKTFDLYTLHADGSQRVDLTRNRIDVSAESPSWSPDGRRIAFVRGLFGRASSVGVYTIGTDGSQVRLVAPHCDRPSWSPDAKRLAANVLLGAHAGRIAVFDGRARSPHLLVVGRLGDSPAWSPDGRRIAFERDGGLVLMKADGSGLATLVPQPPGVVLGDPDW